MSPEKLKEIADKLRMIAETMRISPEDSDSSNEHELYLDRFYDGKAGEIDHIANELSPKEEQA